MTQVKRSNGQSVVASAAYRAGQKLYSEYYGEICNYSRKGGVICSEILLPENAPPEYTDRQTLWNAVEAVEKNKKAQLAYSFDIALQNEFSMDENIELARQFLLDEFVSRGMIVDFAVHEPDKEDGGIKNPHFHVLCPIRPLNPDGTWGAKQKRVYHLDEGGNRIRDETGNYSFDAVPTTDWGRPETLEHWRTSWAERCNQKFAEKGLAEKIDNRSYARQGIELLPQVHEGPTVRQMEAKGIRTDKGDLNRWIKATNSVIRSLLNKIKRLTYWAKELKADLEAEAAAQEVQQEKKLDLFHLLSEYSDLERERSRKYSVSFQQQHAADTLKEYANAMLVLNHRDLHTADDIEARLNSLRETIGQTKSGIHSRQKCMEKLQKQIENAELYQELKPVHDESKRLEKGFKKKKEKYDQQHEGDLIRWKAASRYLYANKLDPNLLPLNEWKSEYNQLSREIRELSATLAEPDAELKELQQIQKMIDKAQRARAKDRQTVAREEKDQER